MPHNLPKASVTKIVKPVVSQQSIFIEALNKQYPVLQIKHLNCLSQVKY